ncbi:hypothetical protein ACP70R_011363 [Stipagrostis hirtigluma subsp. patula]
MAVILPRGPAHRGAPSRRRLQPTPKYNLPPGPRPWPVIGNLNLIGSLPHRSFHRLSARYGPLMSLQFGSFPVVVGSSVEMAKFFLKTSDLSFLDRPRMASGKYTVYNYSGVLWSQYGPYWRQARKLWLTELLSERRLRATEHVRAEELCAMLRDLHVVAASGSGGGRAVVLKDHLLMLTLNAISRMVLGKKYVVEEGGSAAAPGEFRWMIEEIFFLNGRMKKLGKMFDRFLEHVLEEHNKRRRQEGETFVAKDMVDLLLQLADDPKLEVPIERDGVKAFILELITGGTHTSAVAIEWAMSELLRNPRVLAKATEELDRVVGRGRLVAEGDIPCLPYLEAIVKEAMRLHPAVPMLVPQVSREPTSVEGYDTPTGTRVFINVWAISRDPEVWGDTAMEFRPERFIGSSVDVKGQDMELLPFGLGRRMCPAHNLGLKTVQLTLANLLHAFTWRLPDGMVAEELSMEEQFGISLSRLIKLKAVPEPRLPAQVYAEP